MIVGNDISYSHGGGLMKLNIPNDTIALTDEYLKQFKDVHKVSFPKGLKALPIGAFYKQVHLKKVYFDKHITLLKIPESCFHGCISLSHMDIPKSVISIEKNAFKDTTSINELDVPHTVAYIDPEAFSGWKEHQIIYVYDEKVAKEVKTKAEIVVLKEIETQEEVSPHHFIAILKGGHVGRNYYMPMYIPVKANSKKEASDKVRWLPRVKKDHKDVIKALYNVSVKEFYRQVALNQVDPYYKASSKQEQNAFDDLIQERVIMESRKT
jgi:hypothetical protein